MKRMGCPLEIGAAGGHGAVDEMQAIQAESRTWHGAYTISTGAELKVEIELIKSPEQGLKTDEQTKLLRYCIL